MQKELYVSVIFPLAMPQPLTYKVPEDLVDEVAFGIQVEVPLRNKLYAGLVVGLKEKDEQEQRPRKVISILDENPIIDPKQYQFWTWIASYYCCSIGEVMSVAMPSGLKLTSETIIQLNSESELDYGDLTDNEFMLADIMTNNKKLSIGEVEKILDKKSIYKEIRTLLDRGMIGLNQELIHKYKPKTETFIDLQEPYASDPDLLSDFLDKLKRSKKQSRTVLAFIQLTNKKGKIRKKKLIEASESDHATITALVNKGVFVQKKIKVSRIFTLAEDIKTLPSLSAQQQEAFIEIKKQWKLQSTILLHGVTGSGKTRVYMEFIADVIQNGSQVLYLLPEIALTAQIVLRLKEIFGEKVFVYHSRMNNNERVELWKAAQGKAAIVIGARSSLFLPYKDLKLIIVDEEHDPSFKQQDPAPRYNARDAAIFLANSYEAKVLLGSATPSLESLYNTRIGKYGLVEMSERFGEVALPEINIVDLRQERKKKTLVSSFSKALRDHIDEALVNGKQALIFQNRRGYAPSLQCGSCDWVGECINCDIALTKHKFFNELRCHYCGYRKSLPDNCPSCGSDELIELGVGTEKIEDVIKELFPLAKVSRLDYDTTRSKTAYETIISDFESKKVDILVGTQMVTKGLDFENIAVVGVLNADLLLFFPDFRATERAFQLLTQVAGRAGRRKDQGTVYIQTSKPSESVLLDVVNYNYHKFIFREAHERKAFNYPPYIRMIHILLKHKQVQKVQEAAEVYVHYLKDKLGKRVMGPAEPGVARLRGMYLRTITIKLEKNPKAVGKAKRIILDGKKYVRGLPGLKSTRINIDVDPY